MGISLQNFVCLLVFVCILWRVCSLSWTSGPWVCVSLGPETWNLHSLINIQAFTGGCNSELGLPLVLESQRQTTLEGIVRFSLSLLLFFFCLLHEKAVNNWTWLGDICVRVRSNCEKRQQKKQQQQADTDGSPSGFLFLLLSAVRLKGACAKCDVKFFFYSFWCGRECKVAWGARFG